MDGVKSLAIGDFRQLRKAQLRTKILNGSDDVPFQVVGLHFEELQDIVYKQTDGHYPIKECEK